MIAIDFCCYRSGNEFCHSLALSHTHRDTPAECQAIWIGLPLISRASLFLACRLSLLIFVFWNETHGQEKGAHFPLNVVVGFVI